MQRTRNGRRVSNLPLPNTAPEEADTPEDPEMRAAWNAWCARFNRDPNTPPWCEDEWTAAWRAWQARKART